MGRQLIDYDDLQQLEQLAANSKQRSEGVKRDLMMVESIGGVSQAHAVKHLDKLPKGTGLLDFDNTPTKRNYGMYCESMATTVLVLASVAIVAGLGILAWRMLNMAGIKGDARKAVSNMKEVQAAVLALSSFHMKYVDDGFQKLFMRHYAQYMSPDMVRGTNPTEVYQQALSYGLMGHFKSKQATRVTVLMLTGKYTFVSDWLKDLIKETEDDLTRFAKKTLPKIISICRSSDTDEEKVNQINPHLQEYGVAMDNVVKNGKGIPTFAAWLAESMKGTNFNNMPFSEEADAAFRHVTAPLDLQPYLLSFDYRAFASMSLPQPSLVDGINTEAAKIRELGKEIKKLCKQLEEVGLPEAPSSVSFLNGSDMSRALESFSIFAVDRVKGINLLVKAVECEVNSVQDLAIAVRESGRGIYKSGGAASREMEDKAKGKEYEQMLLKEVRSIK